MPGDRSPIAENRRFLALMIGDFGEILRNPAILAKYRRNREKSREIGQFLLNFNKAQNQKKRSLTKSQFGRQNQNF